MARAELVSPSHSSCPLPVAAEARPWQALPAPPPPSQAHLLASLPLRQKSGWLLPDRRGMWRHMEWYPGTRTCSPQALAAATPNPVDPQLGGGPAPGLGPPSVSANASDQGVGLWHMAGMCLSFSFVRW